LDHPNILKISEIYEDYERIYIVCEPVRGLCLRSFMIENPNLTEDMASSIAAQVSSIMRYLHKKNIVIRNLSPYTLVYAHTADLSEVEDTQLKLVDLLFAQW
jgi:eukaryotic-like serine/threonine-protein kinase